MSPLPFGILASAGGGSADAWFVIPEHGAGYGSDSTGLAGDTFSLSYGNLNWWKADGTLQGTLTNFPANMNDVAYDETTNRIVLVGNGGHIMSGVIEPDGSLSGVWYTRLSGYWDLAVVTTDLSGNGYAAGSSGIITKFRLSDGAMRGVSQVGNSPEWRGIGYDKSQEILVTSGLYIVSGQLRAIVAGWNSGGAGFDISKNWWRQTWASDGTSNFYANGVASHNNRTVVSYEYGSIRNLVVEMITANNGSAIRRNEIGIGTGGGGYSGVSVDDNGFYYVNTFNSGGWGKLSIDGSDVFSLELTRRFATNQGWLRSQVSDDGTVFTLIGNNNFAKVPTDGSGVGTYSWDTYSDGAGGDFITNVGINLTVDNSSFGDGTASAGTEAWTQFPFFGAPQFTNADLEFLTV